MQCTAVRGKLRLTHVSPPWRPVPMEAAEPDGQSSAPGTVAASPTPPVESKNRLGFPAAALPAVAPSEPPTHYRGSPLLALPRHARRGASWKEPRRHFTLARGGYYYMHAQRSLGERRIIVLASRGDHPIPVSMGLRGPIQRDRGAVIHLGRHSLPIPTLSRCGVRPNRAARRPPRSISAGAQSPIEMG